MIGIEFGQPRSLKLRASWSALELANKGLFCQIIVIPLFKDHKILSQVAGHDIHTIKLLPPLIITESDCEWIERSFDTVIADAHRVPGAVWSLGKTLVDNAMRARGRLANARHDAWSRRRGHRLGRLGLSRRRTRSVLARVGAR
jgi:ornithine--oxo-acid transaminase